MEFWQQWKCYMVYILFQAYSGGPQQGGCNGYEHKSSWLPKCINQAPPSGKWKAMSWNILSCVCAHVGMSIQSHTSAGLSFELGLALLFKVLPVISTKWSEFPCEMNPPRDGRKQAGKVYKGATLVISTATLSFPIKWKTSTSPSPNGSLHILTELLCQNGEQKGPFLSTYFRTNDEPFILIYCPNPPFINLSPFWASLVA